jgi:hypothetical protein
MFTRAILFFSTSRALFRHDYSINIRQMLQNALELILEKDTRMVKSLI